MMQGAHAFFFAQDTFLKSKTTRSSFQVFKSADEKALKLVPPQFGIPSVVG